MTPPRFTPPRFTLAARLLALPIRAYRLFLSPWFGNDCRYLPTCSAYGLEALERHGAVKGGYLTVHRLCRCHPWGGHGYDPVPGADPEFDREKAAPKQIGKPFPNLNFLHKMLFLRGKIKRPDLDACVAGAICHTSPTPNSPDRPMLDTDEIHPLFHGAPTTAEFQKLRKRLVAQVREAIETYGMARRGDRWLVCLSGGKDSYTLLAILHELKWRGLLPVDLLACNLDQGQPGFPATVLPDFLSRMGVPHRIEYQDTYSIVMDKIAPGGTMCSLCSRLRRGNLYRVAREEGCSTVILGHHRDDILETFFMNLFHGGRLASMPPKLLNEDGDLILARPLALVAEADCAAFATAMQYPIIPCDLCGSQEGLQRAQVKKLLDEWEARTPGRRNIMFRALQNVRPSHLADSNLSILPACWPRHKQNSSQFAGVG